jgi:hypothetical protein
MEVVHLVEDRNLSYIEKVHVICVVQPTGVHEKTSRSITDKSLIRSNKYIIPWSAELTIYSKCSIKIIS